LLRPRASRNREQRREYQQQGAEPAMTKLATWLTALVYIIARQISLHPEVNRVLALENQRKIIIYLDD
jgi:hypothetical protein